MKRLIVVTGALGFIGNRVIQKVGKEEEILGIDIKRGTSSGNVNYVSVDLTNPDNFSPLYGLEKPDSIVHCAAIISPVKCQENPYLAFQTNIMGTLNTLEYARKKDVTKFVYVSTGGIYKNSDPKDIVTEDWPIDAKGIYSISKVAAESTVKDFSQNYGIDAVAIRITAPYGPGMYNLSEKAQIPDALHRHTLIFALKCIRNENIVMPFGGDHTVNYTYVDDIVQGIELSLRTKLKGFEPFNIAGGKNYKIQELGEVTEKLCPNIKVNIGGGDLISSEEKKDPMLSRLSIKQGLFDNSKAKRLLGYAPKYSLEDGMGNLIRDLKSQ